jgi:hypothetical protein
LRNGKGQEIVFDIEPGCRTGESSHDATRFEAVITCVFLSVDGEKRLRRYSSVQDFASVQGSRGWYYENGRDGMMSYNPAQSHWFRGDTFALLWANGGHPGSSVEVVRRWVADADGKSMAEWTPI